MNYYHILLKECCEALHAHSFDGKVILCCQDWKKEYILGDLRTNSIQDIWNSKEYKSIRRRIYGEEIPVPELCQKCILAQ
ncbi:MAG: SPASM domain-containing protein [archaeon]